MPYPRTGHPATAAAAPRFPASNQESHDENSNELDGSIFLLWPNIIDYVLILVFTSLYYMPIHPRTCSLIYSISCLLHALDGHVARWLNQSTIFGAVLDMVTDRCTTTCLLVFLSSAWPRWSIMFQGLISLDLASHYMHMYSSLVLGSAQSHKVVDKKRSWLLNLYYSNKTALFLCCALNEIFFIALYLLAFTSPAEETSSPALSLNPHSTGAFRFTRVNKMDETWPLRIACLSFPIMALKQWINVLQLVNASQWLAEGDMQARKDARLLKRKSR